MSRKKYQPGEHDDTPDHSGKPPSRPAPAAKRRLLRALGGSGGVALAAVLGARWREPVVKAVVLPAHAQSTPVEAVSCLIAVSINEEATLACNPSDATVNIAVQSGGVSTELARTIVTASTASLSAASTFPPGAYGVTAGVSRDEGVFSPLTENLTVNWSCCDDTAAASTMGSSITSAGLSRTAVISDDGQCELSVPF